MKVVRYSASLVGTMKLDTRPRRYCSSPALCTEPASDGQASKIMIVAQALLICICPLDFTVEVRVRGTDRGPYGAFPDCSVVATLVSAK